MCEYKAVVRGGKIELTESVILPEGTKLLVMMLDEADDAFWQSASHSSLAAIWRNDVDDVYAELISK